MPRRRAPLRQAVIYWATFLFFHIFRLLPLPLARMAGRLMGRVALVLVPRLHKVGRQNLDLAYGDQLSHAEKRAILREAAENLGTVAVEFPHMTSITASNFDQHARVEGWEEHVDQTRGALFIGAHLGNWEWMAGVMRHYGARTAEVVRPLDDPRLDRLIDSTRRGSGAVTIPKDDAAGEILRLLRECYIVGVLVDQSPRENAVPSTFFGKPCWATIAPVMIAVRAKVPIHPVSVVREKDGRYVLRFYPAIEMVKTGDLRQDLVENTQRCQDVVEEMIRAHPGQWLWFHRRWKTRPRLEQEWAARLERDARRRQEKAVEEAS